MQGNSSEPPSHADIPSSGLDDDADASVLARSTNKRFRKLWAKMHAKSLGRSIHRRATLLDLPSRRKRRKKRSSG